MITTVRLRDVPFEDVAPCLNIYDLVEAISNWNRFRGQPIRISTDLAIPKNPICDGPFWPLVDYVTSNSGEPVALCAHVLEID